MGTEELVAGDGWISDDSSFYGDEQEQERLLTLCHQSSPQEFRPHQNQDLNSVLAKHRSMPPPELFNPRQGHTDSWQLGESADDFVRRIPPLTTPALTCEWIWAENPHHGSSSKTEWPRLDQFKPRGFKLLQQSIQKRQDIETQAQSKPRAAITRMLMAESRFLQQHISELSAETHVLPGKWMLFPGLEDLTRVWRLVVEGVINNRLGPTAKVAPDDGRPGSRLICVYTKDFRDQQDVLRVLQELVAMGLVESERSIYYKSDAYTYLDIYKENAAGLGLQASLYSSQKLLATANFPKPTSVSQKKQSTLSGFTAKKT